MFIFSGSIGLIIKISIIYVDSQNTWFPTTFCYFYLTAYAGVHQGKTTCCQIVGISHFQKCPPKYFQVRIRPTLILVGKKSSICIKLCVLVLHVSKIMYNNMKKGFQHFGAFLRQLSKGQGQRIFEHIWPFCLETNVPYNFLSLLQDCQTWNIGDNIPMGLYLWDLNIQRSFLWVVIKRSRAENS